ncbi:MAG: hypothetical protein AVDCRST_MAG51-2093 [uncultured Ramlibacter sp.]|uniref:histidine kinase n=1 Tax=uncultured Ramlibacter sp. TaxID=260755 RepID=A0A6J4PR10_9BURK|nr:MAG: hypothetical protein AVDCRST_MAG51-2093 [uncultured Ramlibacter sp.]
MGAYWSSRAVGEATEWVAHSREVETALEEVLSNLKDAETGQRGFLLTSNPDYLEPYVDASRAVPASIDRLERLVARDPSQVQRLRQLRATAMEKLQASADAVGLMQSGDREAALAVLNSGRGKRSMDAAREQIGVMQEDEDRVVQERMRRADSARLTSTVVAGISTGLLLALLGTVYVSARRSNSRIRANLAATEAGRRELDFIKQALDRAAIVAVADESGRLVQVNDEFVRVSGFSREELLGKHHKVVSPSLDEAFYERVRGGQTWRGEVRSQGRDGREFWTDTTAVPLLDEDGKPERYIAIHYEITDRKRAELELRESESRYRTLTEALPHMVWTMAPDVQPTYFSNHWKTFTGLSGDRMSFKEWLELIHPDDRAGFERQVGAPLAAGKPHEAEFRLRRRDGVWRHVISRATPRHDESGTIVQWVGTVTDVEDRWQARQLLRQSEALVQAIVDGSTALVFAKDLEGRYFLTNQAWRELFGLSAQDADGITDPEVFGPEVAARLAAVDREVAQSGRPRVVEEAARIDGRDVTYLSSKFPLRDPQGKVYAVCGVSTDITELKLARGEVQRLNTDLERRVQERTRQLSEANYELEAFSYTVSHDLRAPLRGLQGFAQAVQEDYADRLDAQGRDYLDRIMAAARRMEGLIQDLLEYGRLSREQVQMREVSVRLALDEVLSQLAGELRERRAVIDIQEPLGSVQAHPTMLVQVLGNLVGNALKFVPPGQVPQIRIGSDVREGRVRVFVQDRGIGVRPEHQERIFRVFERLHGQEAFPGTGVGLAIVRKACERMGGSCGVQSEPGKGSTFWFELRAARVEQRELAGELER